MKKKTGKGREILPGIEIIGLTLYLRKDDALIFSDLHLGFEGEMQSQGYLVPRFQYKEVIGHLSAVFSVLGHKPKTIIINGDLKHEFSRISRQEWTEVFSFLDYLGENCEEIILIKGNHDTILGPIASKKNVTVEGGHFFEKSAAYVTHGHMIPRDKRLSRAGTVVIGHDHPAIKISDGVHSEKIKCFLKGRWRKKNLIQTPSLNYVAEGTDLTSEGSLSPFMKRGGRNFEAYCVEGLELLYFGKLKNLQGDG